MNKMINKDLTWKDLGKLYEETTGETPYTRPMDSILNWAINEGLVIETKSGSYRMKPR